MRQDPPAAERRVAASDPTGDEVAQAPESSDVPALNEQRKQMDTLLARLKQILASSTPLNEQVAQIDAGRTRILEWRHSLAERYGLARIAHSECSQKPFSVA